MPGEVVTTTLLDSSLVDLAPIETWQAWIDKTKEQDDYQWRYGQGSGHFEGLRPHLEQWATDAIERCDLTEECQIEVTLPGSQIGSAHDTQLRVGCALMRYVSPGDAEAAEQRCREHHKVAISQFSDYVALTVEGIADAERAKAAADADLKLRLSQL